MNGNTKHIVALVLLGVGAVLSIFVLNWGVALIGAGLFVEEL